MNILTKELEVLELGHKIQTEAQSEMEKIQREYFLREQLKAIQRSWAKTTSRPSRSRSSAARSKRRDDRRGEPRSAPRAGPHVAAAHRRRRIRRDPYLSGLAGEPALEDAHRRQPGYRACPPGARRRPLRAEGHQGAHPRVPGRAQAAPGSAAERLHGPGGDGPIRREREGAILCFVGPPGVGKTSLGASIARAMGRKFTRMCLGGMRDEAEIRGFRRTYIGAMPGRIIQTLRRVETRNPVFMLDEVDKLGRDFRGDPASALLEVLDPEQNHEFRDHYLDVAFDLSEVMFITTANELDTIPGPLRDRMEIIQLSGYTEHENCRSRSSIWSRANCGKTACCRTKSGSPTRRCATIIRDYTREAGVRNLEREIGRVTRKVVTQHRRRQRRKHYGRIKPEICWNCSATRASATRARSRSGQDLPGVATGLSVTPFGGDVLFVEATQMPGGKGFQYTGQLGEVMQESARAAFSYIRSARNDLDLADDYFDKHDIHLHVPAGAVPKDGPSAGVTMATALASLLTRASSRSNVAMTGEITLRGPGAPGGRYQGQSAGRPPLRHRYGHPAPPQRIRSRRFPDEVRASTDVCLAEDVRAVWDAALVPLEEQPAGTGNGHGTPVEQA